MKGILQFDAVELSIVYLPIYFFHTDPLSVVFVNVHDIIIISILSFINLVFIQWYDGSNVSILTY